MNYADIAVNDLKKYISMRAGIINNSERINQLEKLISDAKSRAAGGKSASRYDERVISSIAECDRLKINNDAIVPITKRIERALETLDERERLVLQEFYISRRDGHVRRLCDKLSYEERNVYKLKDKALLKFTVAMYGVLDL